MFRLRWHRVGPRHLADGPSLGLDSSVGCRGPGCVWSPARRECCMEFSPDGRPPAIRPGSSRELGRPPSGFAFVCFHCKLAGVPGGVRGVCGQGVTVPMGPSSSHQQASTSFEMSWMAQPVTLRFGPTHQWISATFGTPQNPQPALLGISPTHQQDNSKSGNLGPPTTQPRTWFCPPVG